MIQKETGRRPQQQVAPPSFPPPSCPRCCSDNTKFCYYNNYTVSQPRYLCKDCRRYWTHGGALRNIPTGGTSRKRGRIDTSSSSSQVSNPPTSGGFDYPGINGRVASRPPIAETMQSFNGGGCYNQTLPFRFSPRGELLGGVNASFGAVNVGFGGMNHLSPLDGFRDFGFSALQPPQNHPLPPSVWTRGQNMVVSSNINYSRTTLSIPNNFLAIARDPAAAANVVGMNEWSELNDGHYEDDALQS